MDPVTEVETPDAGQPAGLDPEAKIRCADWSRAMSVSPAGTAGTYAGFLLVEIPLPWPRDVSETAEAALLEPIVGPPGYRLQAVVPADLGAPAAERRVILHAREPGAPSFTAYRRFESTVGASLPDTVAALVAAAADPGPSTLAVPGVDVLVCGHGRRDSCCGRLGAGLAVRLATGLAEPGVNLWRTSHLGGHRFAPVSLVLPEGTGWAFADPELLDAVIRRDGDVDTVADHYRGCSGLAGPRVQALESEVLRRVGWGLLDSARRGSSDGDSAELSWESADQSETWSATVRPGRTVAMPDCMSPPASAVKTQSEWAVSAVARHEHTRVI